MGTSPYIQWWDDTPEQSLLQELTTESIQFHGIDVTYMPVSLRREDTLYNEDILRQFSQTFVIEAYSKNVLGWEGAGDAMSKFGIRVQDKMTLIIARNRFDEVFATSNPPISRPMEGDLVYIPAPINKLFEIKWVEHEKALGQFYPLGRINHYELQLELHTYNQEHIATANSVIDSTETTEAYGQNLHVYQGGIGSFIIGETVYQGSARGIVSLWSNNTLRITTISGTFRSADYVVGETSGAIYAISAPPDILELPANDIDINRYLANSSDPIIDTDTPPPTDNDLYDIQYLIVGAGGGGGTPGNSNFLSGGGGGGGRVIFSTATVRSGVIMNIIVGDGGGPDENGGYSKLGLIESAVGGGAGGLATANGVAGASGGGAGGHFDANTTYGGAASFGFQGGSTIISTGAGAGGGGAAEPGQSPVS